MINALLVIEDGNKQTSIIDLLREVTDAHIDAVSEEQEMSNAMARFSYDIIMLNLPHNTETENRFINRILNINPMSRIILFTVGAERVFISQHLKTGVKGFLQQETRDKEDIRRALIAVANNRRYLSRGLTASLM